jgi:hypothetical protein
MRLTSAGFSLCLLASACGGGTPQFATSPSFDTTLARRAPGVSEVRASFAPPATRSGNTSERLLFLRTHAGPESARKVVRSFLRAVVSESPDRLDALFAPQAVVELSGGRQSARAFWRFRLAQLDYSELKGELLFRDSDLETFGAEDLSRQGVVRRIPVELSDDEVAVRVPIRLSWLGRPRLFGDELVFKLHPVGTGFEIAQISEDFRMP